MNKRKISLTWWVLIIFITVAFVGTIIGVVGDTTNNMVLREIGIDLAGFGGVAGVSYSLGMTLA